MYNNVMVVLVPDYMKGMNLPPQNKFMINPNNYIHSSKNIRQFRNIIIAYIIPSFEVTISSIIA